jgi:hypothetical protein
VGDGHGRKAGTGDGIGQAVDAARAYGFRGGGIQVEAVDIAGAEPLRRRHITNFKYPDHSIGFWQINQLAITAGSAFGPAVEEPVHEREGRLRWRWQGERVPAGWST